MADLSGYVRWLEAEGYQPSTIESTIRNLQIAATTPEQLKPHHEAHIRRYLRYVKEAGNNPLGLKFVKLMKLESFEASARRRRHGSRVKQLLGRQEWRILRKHLRPRKDGVSQLLLAYMGNPMRIGDFLRQDVGNLDNVVTDKFARDWLREEARRLQRLGKKPRLMHDLLCVTERCAYARLRKQLQLAGIELGYEVDFDTLYKSRQSLEERV